MKVLVTHLCPTLRDPLDPPGSSVPGILHPWDSPGKNTEWVAIPFRGIFLTRGSNLSLLHCKQVVYLSYQGSPKGKGVDCKGSKVFPRSPLPTILGFRHLWGECGNHRDTQPAGGTMTATTTIINNLPESMGKCCPIDTAHHYWRMQTCWSYWEAACHGQCLSADLNSRGESGLMAQLGILYGLPGSHAK